MITSYVSSESKFAHWYFQSHKEYQRNKDYMLIRQLGEPLSHHDMQAVFERALLHLKALSPNRDALGMIYVDYGYSYAAIDGKNGLTFVTRQSGFSEKDYWEYDITEQLGYSDEADQQFEPLELFMQWLDDPKDSLELCHEIFRKILKHIAVETLDRLGESVNKSLLIMLPSLPANAKISWELLISSIAKEQCCVIVDNHGAGMELQPNTSTFLYHNFVIDMQQTTLVEVFSQETNGSIHADAYFYDKEYETDTRKLCTVPRLMIQKENQSKESTDTSQASISEVSFRRLPVRIGNIAGVTAFLRSHAAAFREQMFIPLKKGCELPQKIEKITKLFKHYEALSVAYICSQLCAENELSHISLMDMATTCSLLENRKYFQKTNLITRKMKVAFGVIDELPLDMENIPYIPSNYSSVCWKCSAARDKIPDYHTLNKESIDISHITPALQSIVSHYDSCTTEDIASDLYFIMTGGQEEPSAMLTAKVYLLLAEDASFRAVKTSEIVQKPTIETSEQAAVSPSAISTKPSQSSKDSVCTSPAPKPAIRFTATTPAARSHLPIKVHSKAFGSGKITELTTSKQGTMVTILFDSGIKKTFLEKLALQKETFFYEY